VTGRGDDDDEFDRRPPEITPGDDTQAVRTRSSTAREHDV
jgi:hypothetical protein